MDVEYEPTTTDPAEAVPTVESDSNKNLVVQTGIDKGNVDDPYFATIGAEAEKAYRDSSTSINVLNGLPVGKGVEKIYDAEGESAIVDEAMRKVKGLVPDASPNLLIAIYDEVKESVKKEFEVKYPDNERAKVIYEKLKSGVSVSEILSSESNQAPAESPDYIDTSVPEAPAPGHN